jgi:hypothetical protein
LGGPLVNLPPHRSAGGQCVPSLPSGLSSLLSSPPQASVQRHQPRVRRRRAVTTVSFSSRASRATTPAGTDEAAGHWADANFSPDRQPANQPASGGPRTSTNRRRRFAIKRCVRVLWMSGPHVFGAADLSRRPWRPMRSLAPSLPPSLPENGCRINAIVMLREFCADLLTTQLVVPCISESYYYPNITTL